jgi:peptidoglycan-associated lipoprotein
MLAALAAISLLTGCKGTTPFWNKQQQAPPGGLSPSTPQLSLDGGITSSARPEPIRDQSSQESSELKRVYFGYDSASMLDQARQQLDANANWLKANPGVQVQIEGHCDSRGTGDYNYALGQRRADTVRDYLIGVGVEPGRLHSISYGSERPDDSSDSEMGWARNRRAQFMVYGQ